MEQVAIDTVRVNFTSTLNVCEILFPLLRSNARVVHVSSRFGLLRLMNSVELRQKFANPNATIDDIKNLVQNFLVAAKNGTTEKEGYMKKGYSSYATTKAALNAVTAIQQKNIDQDTSRKGIVISVFCPGYCSTEMSDFKGLISAEKGAQTGLYLALLPDDFKGSKGAFWAENQVINWQDGYILVQMWPFFKKALLTKLNLA